MRWLLFLAAVLVFGPWLYALVAVALDSRQADAQGAFSMATYLSFITLPAGLVLLVADIVSRRH